MSEHEHTNHLIQETSPYLLQHAHNPVDWHPWGEEALAKAKQENKPIFLSIGYSACHWCHVMERESFEDEEIAAYLNQHFVSIKVDREERPDLDSLYMTAVQTMAGHGGWPMTVFLTPEGEPFYGGTYFPPTDRSGMPGFRRVIEAVSDAYRFRRKDIQKTADQMREMLRAEPMERGDAGPLDASLLDAAFHTLSGSYDAVEGGFGSAPKFPQPLNLEFLLRVWQRNGWDQPLKMLERTLQKMARGGMYDQLGGGFHRYSTDAVWLVPHFEKMLYDNALLARVYLHAYQVTGNDFYRRICQETLDYMLREMTSPEGGFYSAQDADSEGEEGKFFVWTQDEVANLLGPEDGPIFSAYYDVTDGGNFEGKNILQVAQDADVVADQQGITVEQLEDVLARGRATLFAAREQRIKPLRDEKVLTGWSGLALTVFAEAASVLRHPPYRQVAERAAEFLLTALRRDDGRLLRTYKDGQAKLLGYLEDYGALAEGLILLHEATGSLRWLQEAQSLAEGMLTLFWDDSTAGFFDTGSDHEQLVARPRDFFDNAAPSGASLAVNVLLRLAVLMGEERYSRPAVRMLEKLSVPMKNYATAFGYLLCGLDTYLARRHEVVIVGDPADEATRALRDEATRRYAPNDALLIIDPGQNDEASAAWPLLQGRTLVDGKPAAYVCENYACQLPVTEPEALAAQLAK